MKKSLVALALLAFSATHALAEEAVDASDPTKIYSYAGPGYKYTRYSNGDYMQELRVTGNIGLSQSDMLLFEIGYGDYNGTLLAEEKGSGVTNGRGRWFHLFNMDYSILSGYRGWATQLDLQFEGSIKGTKGSNTLAAGVMPAFGINEQWSFFLPLNYVSTWGEDFDNHQGSGVSVAPLFSYSPSNPPWPGFFMQVWPSYTAYLSGDLDGEGGANFDLTVGGSPTEKTVISVTLQQNFDKDLNLFSLTPGASSGPNDWNIFANISFYF